MYLESSLKLSPFRQKIAATIRRQHQVLNFDLAIAIGCDYYASLGANHTAAPKMMSICDQEDEKEERKWLDLARDQLLLRRTRLIFGGKDERHGRRRCHKSGNKSICWEAGTRRRPGNGRSRAFFSPLLSDDRPASEGQQEKKKKETRISPETSQ